jgi:hypothetical protein
VPIPQPQPQPLPVPKPHPKSPTIHCPIYQTGRTVGRIHLLGCGDGKLPGSSHPGAWALGIGKDGTSPWVTQLQPNASPIGGYISEREVTVVQNEPNSTNPPRDIRITSLTPDLGSVVNRLSCPISTTSTWFRQAELAPFGLLISTGLSPTLYLVASGRANLHWEPKTIPIPTNFSSAYVYRRSHVQDFAADQTGRTYVLLSASAAIDPRSASAAIDPRNEVWFISIVCLDRGGNLIWGPFSYGEPLSTYDAGNIAVGTDGNIYVLYSVYDRLSWETERVLCSFTPDGVSNTHGWPKKISGNWFVADLRADNSNIYIAGLSLAGGDHPIYIPTATSFSYVGNESAISNTQYHEHGENWLQIHLIADTDAFFTAGYVVRNSHTPQETHELILRKYDKYGLSQ